MKKLLLGLLLMFGMNVSAQDMKMDMMMEFDEMMYPESEYIIQKDLLKGNFEPIGIVESHWHAIYFRKAKYGGVELIRIKKK
ncbi:MAG: hypothetical protein MPJ25_01635 [Pirellulales bacterium]|nr:hypothetical protein [Pirellulales bacterium]